MKNKILTYFLFLSVLLFLSCKKEPGPLKIAVSKASTNYLAWLSRADSGVQTVNLFEMNIAEAKKELESCDGLLLTGGEDVYPGWYGKETEFSRTTGCDFRRDSLEMSVLDLAMELRMPVFGICRGHQLLNVYLGGKLIVDIPSDFGTTTIHQCEDYLKCFHQVYIPRNTLMYSLTAADSATVTTNHHQAVEILSPLLIVNARSADGLTEGTEWLNPYGKNFIMGVQWHPERMAEENPLSGKLAEKFLSECQAYKKNKPGL